MKVLEQQLDLIEHQVILQALDQIQIHGRDAKKIAMLQDKLETGFNMLKKAIEEEKAQIKDIKNQLSSEPEKPKHRFVK